MDLNITKEKVIEMKDTQNFKESHKKYPLETRAYNSIFPKTLIGAKIVDLRYGPDHDGDACLYYIELDNGVKIGMCLCHKELEKFDELDRTKTFDDGSFIRFQFHDWPKDYKKLVEEYKKNASTRPTSTRLHRNL